MDENEQLIVEFKLWDVVAQREMTEGGGSADKAGLRRLSHQIADFVYEEFTGDTAYFDTQIVYVSVIRSTRSAGETFGHYGPGWSQSSVLTSGLDLVLTPRFFAYGA